MAVKLRLLRMGAKKAPFYRIVAADSRAPSCLLYTSKKMFTLDQEINALQSKLLEAVSNVSKLETAKVEVDQKRKHALETLSKENLKENIANMKAILSDVVNEYNDRVERLDNTQEELTTIIGQQE